MCRYYISGALLVAYLCVTTSSKSTANDSISEPIDFTTFETTVLPLWIKRFTVDYDAGLFSFTPVNVRCAKDSPQEHNCVHSKAADLYGSADMIHVLSAVGLLDNLTTTQKSSWAASVDSFQVSPLIPSMKMHCLEPIFACHDLYFFIASGRDLLHFA